MHDGVNADTRDDDLREFDAAVRRLYRHGLLSDETLVRLHDIVHREAWAMREISRLASEQNLQR
jgi:hypothetical protein